MTFEILEVIILFESTLDISMQAITCTWLYFCFKVKILVFQFKNKFLFLVSSQGIWFYLEIRLTTNHLHVLCTVWTMVWHTATMAGIILLWPCQTLMFQWPCIQTQSPSAASYCVMPCVILFGNKIRNASTCTRVLLKLMTYPTYFASKDF